MYVNAFENENFHLKKTYHYEMQVQNFVAEPKTFFFFQACEFSNTNWTISKLQGIAIDDNDSKDMKYSNAKASNKDSSSLSVKWVRFGDDDIKIICIMRDNV